MPPPTWGHAGSVGDLDVVPLTPVRGSVPRSPTGNRPTSFGQVIRPITAICKQVLPRYKRGVTGYGLPALRQPHNRVKLMEAASDQCRAVRGRRERWSSVC